MKKYLQRLLFLIACVSITNQLKAQDIHFSQFYENAILRNPALTGIFSGDYKYGINYRNQWSSISVPFQTGLASAETRIPVNEETMDCLSIGATLTYDHAGSINFNSLQVYPAINYNKSLEDKRQSYISAGFTVGYVQRSIDPTKMKFASQYFGGNFDPNNASGENMNSPKMSYVDVGAGMSFNSSMGRNNSVNYYIGAAAYHVNKPKASFNPSEGFVRMNTRWNGNLGFQWAVNPTVGITFHGNYSQQGPYKETIMGAMASWRKTDASFKQRFVIYGGLFYRFNDAYIPTVKLDYKKYSITVSYDLNTSTLRTASQGIGGFELSLFARGALTNWLWKEDKTKCPRFEHMITPDAE